MDYIGSMVCSLSINVEQLAVFSALHTTFTYDGLK